MQKYTTRLKTPGNLNLRIDTTKYVQVPATSSVRGRSVSIGR